MAIWVASIKRRSRCNSGGREAGQPRARVQAANRAAVAAIPGGVRRGGTNTYTSGTFQPQSLQFRGA